MAVKGFNSKIGGNVDEDREREGKPTQASERSKKPTPAPVRRGQGSRLKKETVHPARPYRREHDQLLEARDALMMGLLIEHALRVSEVAVLNVEHLNRETGNITIYREKTHQTDTHHMHTHTLLAAETYLDLLKRTSGPLFVGYEGKRITRQGIYDRVRLLGRQVGIDNLSPHDLRHYWT